MIYREIFEDVGPARDYATRMTVSDAPAYEFDLSNTEIDQLQGKKRSLFWSVMIPRIIPL